ncbi:phasin family protein [Halomonas sp. Bachu 37]|uniref:phasin family protein n=1 Tax=Halomonas kashgarensis TaxID=3084920 RepID=UPI00321729D5
MNKSSDKVTQQMESVLVAPMRTYTVAALDYYEKLLSAQLDAARSYTDLNMAQARVWLEVKDADTFKKAVESQQKTVSDLSERMKGDAEKILSLSQDFAQQSQKMTETSANKSVASVKAVS